VIPPADKDSHRSEYILVVVLAGILYYISVAPGVLWQDSGLAQMRVLEHDFTGTLGLALAHPLYYLVAGAFQLLPFSDSAFKTNLVSAACAVFTVANVYLLLVSILPAGRAGRFGTIVGTTALALAHTFWLHAALAEVYTLSTCILTFELLALVRFARGGSVGWYLLAWFLNGLECSNHVLAVLTAAAVGIWSIWLVREGRLKIKWFVPAMALWIVGNAPYEYLGYCLWRDGQSIGMVIRSMLFGRYRDAVFNLGISKRLLVMSIATIALNFPTPNILLIPAGIAKGLNRLGRSVFVLLIAATGIHFAFAVRYDVPDLPTFFVIPTLFLAIWAGVGAGWLIARAPRMAWVVIVLALANPLVYLCLPRILEGKLDRFTTSIPYRNEGRYLLWPWKTGYDGPERFARDVFAMVPDGSIIIADSTSRRPLRYYQAFEHLGSGVKIVFDPCKDHKVDCLNVLLGSHAVFVVHPSRCPRYIVDNFTLIPAGHIYQVVAGHAKPLLPRARDHRPGPDKNFDTAGG